MNKCAVCDKQISGNRKTCSPTCRTAYGNKIRGENNLKRYNENPNHCLFCKKPIIHKEGDILRYTQLKKFCNKKCAGFYNNSNRPLSSYAKVPVISVDRKCYKCQQTFSIVRDNNGKFPRVRVCELCRKRDLISVDKRTINELFKVRKNYQSARSEIRRHAYITYIESNKPKICKLCGYSKHIDVAHIKAVADFDKNTLISVVNNINNLVGLCLNHHWEYDHDLLSQGDLDIIRK